MFSSHGTVDSNQKIIASGLVLNIDAAQKRSYPGSGATLTDLSGNANTGTLVATPTFNSSNGGNLVFNGSTQYVNCGNGASVNLTNNGSVGFWFKITTITSAWQGIVAKRISATTNDKANYGFNFIGSTTNLFQFYYNSNSINYRALSVPLSTNFTAGVWYNVYATFAQNSTNTDVKLYSNGVLIGSSTLTNNIATATTNLILGASTSIGEFFNGALGNVYIYNRALSETEVLNNFNAIKSRFGYGLPIPITPLVQYKILNNQSWAGSGTTITNLGSGGSTYNGTISGGYTAQTLTGMGTNTLSLSTGIVSIPSTSAIYSSNFTWIIYHIPLASDTSLLGLLWSEAGTKNFLWTYANIGNGFGATYGRIDTPTTVYYSPGTGTQSNGFGGVGGTFQAYNRTIATILVKNGTTFNQYYIEAPTNSAVPLPTILWTGTISDWSIGAPNQTITLGSNGAGSFQLPQTLVGLEMYNSALTTTEIQVAVEAFGFKYTI